jgi:hypothetical protein
VGLIKQGQEKMNAGDKKYETGGQDMMWGT